MTQTTTTKTPTKAQVDLSLLIKQDSPENFARSYFINLPKLINIDEPTVRTILTNPDKYSSLAVSLTQEKVQNLQSVTIKDLKVAEQKNNYALVSILYNSSYRGQKDPLPNYTIIILGKKDGKWYLESDLGRYNATIADTIRKDGSTLFNDFINSPEGKQFNTDFQKAKKNHQDFLNQMQQKINAVLQPRNSELSEHQAIF